MRADSIKRDEYRAEIRTLRDLYRTKREELVECKSFAGARLIREEMDRYQIMLRLLQKKITALEVEELV